MMRRGFTLIEILVVIAIISIVAAILFPTFARAKASAKTTDCLAKSNQLLKATMLYVTDSDGRYPQSRKSSGTPWIADADGSLEEPDYGSIFPRLNPYLGTKFRDITCMEDRDPKGQVCESLNPDVPDLLSYIYNGNFAFGLTESGVERSSETVLFAERRSETIDEIQPFCNYLYRPWFNGTNAEAPENDMHDTVGAIATTRHQSRSIYSFADGHAKSLAFAQTFNPNANVNLHKVN